MKLAEALLLRTEQQQKLELLEGRIRANLKVQEGDTPHEDPEALLREAMEADPDSREEIQLAAEISRKLLEGREVTL